jgi:hypothetical protein
MIQDSIPWKDELLRVADRLEKKRTQKRWTERSGFLVERDIMISAYALRKLKEANKLSDALDRRTVVIHRHDLTCCPPDLMSRWELWEHYDLERYEEVEVPITVMCNQIIHSWNWTISASEAGEFDGVYVSSDRARKQYLYFVPIDSFIALLREVGNEYVTRISLGRDENGELKYVYKGTDDMPDASSA